MSPTTEQTRVHVVRVFAEYQVRVEVQPESDHYEAWDLCSDIRHGVVPNWRDVQLELPRGVRCVDIEIDRLEADVEGDE